MLSSCSSGELPVRNELQVAKEMAKSYSFSVPAVMGDEADTRVFNIGESTISSRFDEGEEVWIFIKKSNGDIAYGNSALYPTNVSPDGLSCTIEADSIQLISGTPNFAFEAGNEVYLYYGMSINTALGIGQISSPIEGFYSFETDGKKETAESMDYCLAEMVVKEVDADSGKLTFAQKEDESKTYFNFKNINSIFRQKVTYRIADGPKLPAGLPGRELSDETTV